MVHGGAWHAALTHHAIQRHGDALHVTYLLCCCGAYLHAPLSWCARLIGLGGVDATDQSISLGQLCVKLEGEVIVGMAVILMRRSRERKAGVPVLRGLQQ